ncbi:MULTISPECIES: hypothetical protein [Streptomyces]|uniref:hypothetical protein n=1 Tax=Streptomyces TaxID=1883 RepID=UPI0011813B5E|nr:MULTISPECIES: hypothetical protein [Streptomyces]
MAFSVLSDLGNQLATSLGILTHPTNGARESRAALGLDAAGGRRTRPGVDAIGRRLVKKGTLRRINPASIPAMPSRDPRSLWPGRARRKPPAPVVTSDHRTGNRQLPLRAGEMLCQTTVIVNTADRLARWSPS